METVERLAEQLNGMQEAMIALQKDRNIDDKRTILKQGTIIMILGVLLAAVSAVFIICTSWSNVEHQRILLESTTRHEANLKEVMQENDKRFLEFISEYEFEVTYSQDLNVDNGSNATDVNKMEIGK